MTVINNSINDTCRNGFSANGGNINISTDSLATAINISTGAGVKQTTIGSVNSTSFTSIQSGSGGVDVTATNGNFTVSADDNVSVTGGTGVTFVATDSPFEINSGTGNLDISSDAAVTTITIGAAATQKNITIGNSTFGSSLDLIGSNGGGVSITSNNGQLTIASGIGLLDISTDNTTSGINIGTSGSKSLVLGNSNAGTSIDLNFPTGGLSILPFGAGALVSTSSGVITSASGAAGLVLTSTGTSTAPTFQASTFTTFTITTTSASTYTVAAGDLFIAANSTSNTITIQLPNAPATGRYYVIKDSNGTSNTNNITITTVGGSVSIDGSTSYVMNNAFQSINVVFTGSTYLIY